MGVIKRTTRYLPGIIVLIVCTGNLCIAQNNADSTKNDSLLLKQIEEQMQSTTAAQPAAQPARSTATANPDIGVIGDFQGSYISRGKRNLNAYLNETEISLQATVDPYIRG